MGRKLTLRTLSSWHATNWSKEHAQFTIAVKVQIQKPNETTVRTNTAITHPTVFSSAKYPPLCRDPAADATITAATPTPEAEYALEYSRSPNAHFSQISPARRLLKGDVRDTCENRLQGVLRQVVRKTVCRRHRYYHYSERTYAVYFRDLKREAFRKPLSFERIMKIS